MGWLKSIFSLQRHPYSRPNSTVVIVDKAPMQTDTTEPV